METLKFVDLFAGLGGFHLALGKLGHECVFASEIDSELRGLYVSNFPRMRNSTFGDIRKCKRNVPRHDVLCAGFPCQPFSKSGDQRGTDDPTDGTLFHEIIEILHQRNPGFVILENVGNFERHDNGRTWAIVRDSLLRLGYHVRGTLHLGSASPDGSTGHGLVSPHHLGHPHHRERFFVVASSQPLRVDPFPPRLRPDTSLSHIVEQKDELDTKDGEETRLTRQQERCITHWQNFVKAIPENIPILSPLWTDEFGASYPYVRTTPHAASADTLRRNLPQARPARGTPKSALIRMLPSYARSPTKKFPDWKIAFIRENREFYNKMRRFLPGDWLSELRKFPSSLRKLEWNVKGEARDIWQHALQFRPSGLRVKRYTSSPALVAMTATQVPILGPERRFLTRTEGLRLQGFPDDFRLPERRASAFTALGNAVHVAVVRAIAERALSPGGPVA